MEARLPETAKALKWSEEFSRTLQAQRDRARQILQAENDRIARIESTLSDQLQKVTDELNEDRSSVDEQNEQLEQMKQKLAQQQLALEQREAAVQHGEDSSESRRVELDQRKRSCTNNRPISNACRPSMKPPSTNFISDRINWTPTPRRCICTRNIWTTIDSS